MPTPSSIKTARLLLFLKLALILFVLILALLLLVVPDSLSSGWSSYREKTLDSMFKLTPDEYKAGHFGIVVINFLPAIIAIVLNVFFLHKRKRLVSILLALLVLWFSSNNTIQLVLSFAVVVLLFTRSARAYFASSSVIGPEADVIEAEGETVEDEDGGEEESAYDGDADDGDSHAEEKSGDAAEDRIGKAAAGEKAGSPAGRNAASKPSASGAVMRLKPKPSADPDVEIREAGADDAEVVHALMLEAFEEYRAAVPPSSALSETVESVREALAEGGECAAILYEDDTPAAMVRYRIEDDAIYFFRLSVLPARRKRGYARKLVEWIELRGRSQGLPVCRCKVRQTVSRNLVLYENMGYEIKDQELVVRPEGTVKALLLEKKLGPS